MCAYLANLAVIDNFVRDARFQNMSEVLEFPSTFCVAFRDRLREIGASLRRCLILLQPEIDHWGIQFAGRSGYLSVRRVLAAVTPFSLRGGPRVRSVSASPLEAVSSIWQKMCQGHFQFDQ